MSNQAALKTYRASVGRPSLKGYGVKSQEETWPVLERGQGVSLALQEVMLAS